MDIGDLIGELRCWCGGQVGPREPGDDAGLGCLEDIWHMWEDKPNGR